MGAIHLYLHLVPRVPRITPALIDPTLNDGCKAHGRKIVTSGYIREFIFLVCSGSSASTGAGQSL
jgi:hypothetical protein